MEDFKKETDAIVDLIKNLGFNLHRDEDELTFYENGFRMKTSYMTEITPHYGDSLDAYEFEPRFTCHQFFIYGDTTLSFSTHWFPKDKRTYAWGIGDMMVHGKELNGYVSQSQYTNEKSPKKRNYIHLDDKGTNIKIYDDGKILFEIGDKKGLYKDGVIEGCNLSVVDLASAIFDNKVFSAALDYYVAALPGFKKIFALKNLWGCAM